VLIRDGAGAVVGAVGISGLAGFLDLNSDDDMPGLAGKGDDSGVVRDQRLNVPVS
jgi:hypothetical protein